MKRIIILLLQLFCIASAIYSQEETKIYLFKVEEDIAQPAVMRVEKALEKAKENQSDLLIMQLNTFGGELAAADKIRTMLLQSEIPVWAYIDNNAASAGALISIACERIYMHSGSSIGAATVVNQTGEVQPDKYQSYMRSMMRATAEARGRRPDIAEAMVDPDVEVKDIVDSGKVLTFTTEEAIANNYCEGQAESVKELLEKAGVQNYVIEEQHYTFIEKVINFLINPMISGLLIMLIIGGIYFEFQSPGIGFPLAMAVLGALLYFAPLYLEGLAANWEIILFVVGIALLALELFVIPGFGVAGVGGIIFIVGGLALSLVGNIGFDFSGVPTSDMIQSFSTVIIAISVSFPLAIWLGKRLFVNTTIGDKLALVAEQKSSEGYTVSQPEFNSLVGSQGVAETILRPSGKVRIGTEVYDAVAQVSYIEKGEKIRVVMHENSNLVVEKE
ncbi:MAG: nodulation protein NfeD [Bacteroidales bacterium]|nr:nodulation protein NfeD [Bacteroidales bacterium]